MANMNDLTSEQMERLAREKQRHWKAIADRLRKIRIQNGDTTENVIRDADKEPTPSSILKEEAEVNKPKPKQEPSKA